MVDHMAYVLRKQRSNSKKDWVIKPHSPALSERLTPTRLHLLKGLHPFQTAPPAEDKVFKHKSLWGTFYIQTATKCMFLLLRWEVDVGCLKRSFLRDRTRGLVRVGGFSLFQK